MNRLDEAREGELADYWTGSGRGDRRGVSGEALGGRATPRRRSVAQSSVDRFGRQFSIDDQPGQSDDGGTVA